MKKTELLRIFIIAGVFFSVAATSFLYGKYFPLPSFLDEEKQGGSQYGEVPQIDFESFRKDVLTSLLAKSLSKNEYRDYRKGLSKIIQEQDPRVALETLRKDATAQKVGSDCHSLTHEIGRIAYHKYRDPIKAFQYQEQVCGFGYIHGVVESYIEDVPNPLKTIQTTCQKYQEERLQQECYHAVGHALMIYYSNDVPLALAECDKYEGDREKVSCGQGVFMENFMADENHRSQYTKSEDPFYPCAEQKDIYKSNCYKMSAIFYLSLHDGDFSHSLEWCSTAEDRFRNSCVRGVLQNFIQYTSDIGVIEKFCLSGTNDQIAPCIKERVRTRLLQVERKDVKAMCEKLSYSTTRAICLEASEMEPKF